MDVRQLVTGHIKPTQIVHVDGKPWPARRDELAQRQQFGRTLPRTPDHLENGICPGDVKQRIRLVRLAQFTNRIDGVRGSRSINLQARYGEVGVCGRGEERHVVPVFGGAHAVQVFVRRVPIGDE